MTVDEFISQFNNDNRDFVAKLFFSQDQDSSYLNNLRSDFKTKFLEPLSVEVRKIRPDDIKKIFDPLGLGETSEDLEKDFKNYRKKIKEFLDIDIPNIKDNEERNDAIKNSSMVEVSGVEKTIQKNETEEQNVSEQKGFGPKINIIALDDSTKDFFLNLFEKIDGYEVFRRDQSRKQEKYYQELLKKQDELIASSNESGFLGTLGKLLAVGGIGALLISTFWDSHIKPWLEKRFNINLDFFDKFEGLIEGIGKFFTLGAQGIGGAILKIKGQIFTSIADILDNSLGSVLKAIFGEAAESGGAKFLAGGAKLFTGSFFARLAGGLLKGVGITMIKGIPVIGSLISFYFAYDRFQKGDYVGSVIDVVGGLANLLSLTPLAPLALPLSLGAAALNAFLDIKYGGTGDAAKESKNKLNFFGNIAEGIYNMLIKIPLIGGMIDGVTGIWNLLYSLASGDQQGSRKALEQMTRFPLLGALPAILLAFLDVTDASYTEGNGNKLTIPDFLQAFKKRVGQTVLKWFSWLPISWQQSIADFMGVPFNGQGGEDFDGGPKPKTPQEKQKELEQLAEKPQVYSDKGVEDDAELMKQTHSEYQRALKEMDDKNTFWERLVGNHSDRVENVKFLQEKIAAISKRIEEYEKLRGYPEEQYNVEMTDAINDIKEKLNKETQTEKVEDFIIHDKSRNRSYIPAANDEIVGLKPDGVIDKALKEIKMVASDINKNINNLNQALISGNEKQSQTTMVNVRAGGNGYTGKEYLMDSERDAIFNARVNWWVHSQKIRATI